MRANKYIILLGDGMPDEGERTPLMVAETPNLDALARDGLTGSVMTTPPQFEPGSDVTNMGILGYDPALYYTGRAPLEAGAMKIDMAPGDVAFRMNFVTTRPDSSGAEIMDDFSAGHIDSDSAGALIASLNDSIADDQIRFHAGVGYRHLMIWRDGADDIKMVAPHDISGAPIAPNAPRGAGSEKLIELTRQARDLLADHPANRKRVETGEKPANSIWFWGSGRAPELPSFKSQTGLEGAMISAVDLMRGIAIRAGMKTISVDNATGWIDTNYEGKTKAALDALEELDFVFLHLEAPDEAGHVGSFELKVEAIENFDRRIVGPIKAELEARLGRGGAPFRILALSDHPTPVALRRHTTKAVPFALYPRKTLSQKGSERFDERIVSSAPLKFSTAVALNRYFLDAPDRSKN